MAKLYIHLPNQVSWAHIFYWQNLDIEKCVSWLARQFWCNNKEIFLVICHTSKMDVILSIFFSLLWFLSCDYGNRCRFLWEGIGNIEIPHGELGYCVYNEYVQLFGVLNMNSPNVILVINKFGCLSKIIKGCGHTWSSPSTQRARIFYLGFIKV
jgi:hypothetical protein